MDNCCSVVRLTLNHFEGLGRALGIDLWKSK